MEILKTNYLVIRNHSLDDLPLMAEFNEISNDDLDSFNELKESISNSINDDLNSEGVKRFAIDKNDKMVGDVALSLEKPYILFSYKFYKDADTRINAQDLIFNFIKYLHKLYPHREISTTANKFDYQKRSILENLNFKRIDFNREMNMYTYSIFLANPNK